MPPKKTDKKGGAKTPAKAPKVKKEGGGKAKKKKWSKGKVRDKLNNMVLFDKATYDKMYKEVITYKLITPAVVSERLKVRVSLAKAGLRELHQKGLIRRIVHTSSMLVYTRTTKGDDAEGGEEGGKKEEQKETKKQKQQQQQKEAKEAKAEAKAEAV